MKKLSMFIGLAVILAVLPWGLDLAFGNTGPAGATFYANSPILQKFVDPLPGLNAPTAPGGQFIPVAIPDTTTYPGSDYYVIGLKDYTQAMHTNLPKATKLRGYYQINTADPVAGSQHYLGPLILARRYDPTLPAGVAGNGKPVRLKFENHLGVGAAGNLFLPMDGTLMGAGMGPDGMNSYTQNRAAIHLHGGFTPWISDGTPHQWITPIGSTIADTPYLKGVSAQNVPDMQDPGQGSSTYYYSNQQSNRLMFYHDHALGITRLNVYAGEAAGYLITDAQEDALINAGTIPNQGGGVYNYGIPLIIQDKSFVPADIDTQDVAWNQWRAVPPGVADGLPGDLWFPHIYEPNQNDPNGPTPGMNPYGRWDYGPWVQPNILAPIGGEQPAPKAVVPLPGTTVNNPAGYLTSVVPESFMDTMLVNGAAYPYLNVQPTAYRFRILNACNDRFLNLQMYLDASGGGSGAAATAIVNATGNISAIGLTNGGSGYVRAPGINITGGGGFGAMATATITGGVVTGITITNPGRGYTSAPTVTIGAKTEVSMVQASPNGSYPITWPTDGRDGGVPDPATAGPQFIQIGTEGGFLPGVVVHPNQPINYDYDRGSATFGNVLNTGGGITIFLGPAERADVIVDFSGVAPGTNVILYNDAPAPVPGFQPRYDYYTGNPDQTAMGGATQTQVGVGPNTRTIMQFRVQPGTPAPYTQLAALQAALPAAFAASQPPLIVPEGTYGSINATSLTYTPVGSAVPKTQTLGQKAIVELFEQYGRMNATLGYEFFEPNTNPPRSNGVGFAYIDPPDEIFRSGETQIWKITHNGVDTHAIHFHLVNVQLVNRVGWDGVVKPPEPLERGWKDTIRMNPLESIFVAIKADLPKVPFSVPHSIRPLNPTMPLGSTVGFTNINPKTGQPLGPTPVVNVMYNFGHEYVWHCHLLGHEENDMMRPLVVQNPSIHGWVDLLLLN